MVDFLHLSTLYAFRVGDFSIVAMCPFHHEAKQGQTNSLRMAGQEDRKTALLRAQTNARKTNPQIRYVHVITTVVWFSAYDRSCDLRSLQINIFSIFQIIRVFDFADMKLHRICLYFLTIVRPITRKIHRVSTDIQKSHLI